MANTITADIRKFILSNYLFSEDESLLKDDQSLLDTGVLDSTGVLELITFLEEQFGLKIADEEMTPENLDSVDRITQFVQRKKQ
jgi:acyl carrier protein